MRRLASMLIAAAALMPVALTSASAGCYVANCDDGGYRAYGPSYLRHWYPAYYDSCRGDCGYYGRYAVYDRRPLYNYGYHGGCGYGGCAYRVSSGCGACGYQPTSYYAYPGYNGCNCGYATTVRYGAWMQTAYGWNNWGGCRAGWGWFGGGC